MHPSHPGGLMPQGSSWKRSQRLEKIKKAGLIQTRFFVQLL